jgi:hypothetical protein
LANAERLLLLADKYDIPGITGHVKALLSADLEGHLTVLNAGHWLELTSKCGLNEEATICIRHIVKHSNPLPLGLISTIQPKHADELVQRLQTECIKLKERQGQNRAVTQRLMPQNGWPR